MSMVHEVAFQKTFDTHKPGQIRAHIDIAMLGEFVYRERHRSLLQRMTFQPAVFDMSLRVSVKDGNREIGGVEFVPDDESSSHYTIPSDTRMLGVELEYQYRGIAREMIIAARQALVERGFDISPGPDFTPDGLGFWRRLEADGIVGRPPQRLEYRLEGHIYRRPPRDERPARDERPLNRDSLADLER